MAISTKAPFETSFSFSMSEFKWYIRKKIKFSKPDLSDHPLPSLHRISISDEALSGEGSSITEIELHRLSGCSPSIYKKIPARPKRNKPSDDNSEEKQEQKQEVVGCTANAIEKIAESGSPMLRNRRIRRPTYKIAAKEIENQQKQQKQQHKQREVRGSANTLEKIAEPGSPKNWNGRTRTASKKIEQQQTQQKVDSSLPCLHRSSMSMARGGSAEKTVKFSISLSQREIEEDFIAITGSRSSLRPKKKRSRTNQRQIDKKT